MQIVGLSQWVNRRKMGEKGVKGEILFVTCSITIGYKLRT